MKTNRSDEGVSGARKKRLKVAAEAGVPAAVTEVKAETEPEPETGIPPCPPEDPRYGDKTVAVVAWFKEYRPEEFVKRYSGRVFRQD